MNRWKSALFLFAVIVVAANAVPLVAEFQDAGIFGARASAISGWAVVAILCTFRKDGDE